MLNLGSDSCKHCIIGIKFTKFRISQDEADLNCKRRCSYRTSKQEDTNQLDMFETLTKPPVRLT